LAKELYGDEEGSHATPSEVAVTQYVYPEAIKSAPLDLDLRSQERKIYGADDFRRRYPDGRMGSNPALATPEHGKQFFDLAVKELTSSYYEFLQG
jgi:creatinine amidohydrolase